MTSLTDKGIRLTSYMKGPLALLAILIFALGGVMVVAFRREAAAGSLEPMTASNPRFLSLAVMSLSFLALMVGFAWMYLLIGFTTFSLWGIRRPRLFGNLAIPWTDISSVTAYPYGLKFHSDRKTLTLPFRVMESLPEELLSLLRERAPHSALASLGWHDSDHAT